MTDEVRPGAERSTVDVTIDPDDMLAVRDRLRATLIQQYHYLLIEARAHRKVGRTEEARVQEEEARVTALMIWSLDNPMKALTPKRKRLRQ